MLSARTGQNIRFGVVDLSLAPTPAEGDSIGDILIAMGLEDVGAPGTTAALAMLNESVKRGGLMAASYVGGLSGAFIPVSEDQAMIRAVQRGNLTIEKLEAMSCICSVGLDMVAVSGRHHRRDAGRQFSGRVCDRDDQQQDHCGSNNSGIRKVRRRSC
jgi:uncharacterized protein